MLLGNNTRSSNLIFAGIVLVIILFFAFAIHFIMADNIVGNDILVFYLAAKSSFIDGQGPYLSENASAKPIALLRESGSTGRGLSHL